MAAEQIIDDQELDEREKQASAEAKEDPKHFVEYCIESARESRESRREILDTSTKLWDAYNNMMEFGEKEEWQSKVILAKPFAAVERAIAIIRRAFKNPNYITTKGVEVEDQDMSEMAKKGISYWFSPQRADFPRKFANAGRMSLATGLSLELIPRWENGFMLDFTEPWKICRDPDALPGEPWSGNYMIHEEWIDKWKIEELAKNGYYINVDQVTEGGSQLDIESTKEELERRKKMFWQRAKYRKAVLVREFNGVVLGKDGDMLLPNAKYTIASDVLIRAPKAIPFVNIKWAGSSFAPIPHILRYDGRGLIEGVFDIWKMLNNTLSLSMDDFSWAVNRMREITPELFLDPTDLDLYPGKDIYRTLDNPDQPSVKDLMGKSIMNDLLAFLQFGSQQIDNGDFVSEFVAGLPGSRSQITKGEVEIKTEQNMGIFDSIGTEIESGAVNVGYASWETIVLNWNADSSPSPSRVLGDNAFTRFLEGASLDEKKQFLKENCDIGITGISAQMQNADKAKMLMAIKQFIDSPVYHDYFKVKEYVDELVGTIGMYNAPFVKTKDELDREQIGQSVAQQLGDLITSGPPEVKQAINYFLSQLGIQLPQGGAPNITGGEEGGGEPMPQPQNVGG